MTTTLYLVRHCQSHPAPETAEPDWPLSEHGHHQAQALVPVLTELRPDVIVSSPYRRCLQTLAPTARHLGLSVWIDPALRERLLSPAWLPDLREVWRRSWQDLSFALAGGESSLACRERVVAAIDRIVRVHPGRTILVGSHGNALALFLSAFTPGYGIAEASALRTPDLVRVTHGPGGYRWHRQDEQPTGLDRIALHYSRTPGITV